MGNTWTNSQLDAINVRGKTLLVSAAAGSGKTSVLTERIIRSLTDPNDPADLSRLLVVTFTRAAAAELKGRIGEALSAALAKSPDDQRLAAQLLKLGSAQISTIDSFFQKLVRCNFEKLGLSATFRIADEQEIFPLAVGVLEDLIPTYYNRYTNQGTEADSLQTVQNNRFADALDHLMSNRSDGKLFETLLEFYADFQSYPEGIKLLQSDAERLRNLQAEDFLQTPWGEVYLEFFQPLFEEYAKELRELEEAMKVDANVYNTCIPLLSSDLSFCELMVTTLKARDYRRAFSAAKSFFVGKFPTIKGGKTKESIDYQVWRDSFRKVVTEKLQSAFQYSPEEIVLHMGRTADFCEILYCFFRDYEELLMKEKKLRGILEHNDVRAMVYSLLSDTEGKASAFADSLSEQYDAVYIDEYQDVDAIQDAIFKLIGRNRRFMVGDIKQSIYGFRGSEPSIFAEYRRTLPLYGSEGAENADGNSIFMSDNFRCDRPIIEFTNCVCSFLFSACEKSIRYREVDDLKPSKKSPEKTAPGYPFPVQFAVFDKLAKASKGDADEEEGGYNQEAAWIAAEISRLLREGVRDNNDPISPSDIAILVRSKKHGKGVTQALKMLSIPVSSETSADFLHDPELVTFLNLLRSIDNPYRDLPLSEFLISRAGGYQLSELEEIRSVSGDSCSLFDAMCTVCEQNSLPHLTEKLNQTLQWLEKWRAQAAVLSADRLVHLLLLEEYWVNHSSKPPLMMLYEQARLYQRNSWNALYGFLSHMDKLLDSEKISAAGFAKAENAVTVMTIHHSKGLEFPVVFVMACGSQFNESDARDTLVYHRNTGTATKLYNKATAEHDNTALREACVLANKLEQHEENIRTLYVALTRAKERLYVSGTLRGKWENLLNSASCVRRGNRSTILSCIDYLAWLTAAMSDAKRNYKEFPCTFHHFSADEWDNGVPLEPKRLAEVTAESSDSASMQLYADLIRTRDSIPYPLQILHGLPTKAAASKLIPNLLDKFAEDADSEEMIQTQISLMSSYTPTFDRLLSEQKKAGAADIGTATHAFMEFCDFERLMKHGFSNEKARLVEMRFMRSETADLVDEKKIEAFCASELMSMIRSAKRVYREQKFSILVPMATLTEKKDFANALGDHSLYVQGSIDLLLEDWDGGLVLVDYKTDRVNDAERTDRAALTQRMKKAHGIQLSYYASAVEQLFGKSPDRICLYLLSLGDMIEI